MNWYNASIIAGTSALVTAVVYPFAVATLRRIGIDIAMTTAAQAKGEAAAAVEIAERVIRENVELRKQITTLAHEIENVKCAHQMERDWMQAQSRASGRGRF